jgi:hypothetical protein
VLLQLYALQLASGLLVLQRLVQEVLSVNWLQLLKVPHKHHVRARAQFAEGNLKASPDFSVDLTHLIHDDQVVVPQSPWWVILRVSVS